MKIKLNGKDYFINKEISVSELLNNNKLNPNLVAVEINMNIIDKNEYDRTLLKDGDTVEILHFVGGG